VDPPVSGLAAPCMTCPGKSHRMWRRKTRRNFFRKVIHRNIHRPHSPACGKQVRLRGWLRSFPHIPNGRVAPLPRDLRRGGSRTDRLRRAGRLGYPSRVCSIMGDAIDRIADAIDQLASDAQGETGEPESGALAVRVAELWLMVGALDPELARRKQGYTTPADGAPSP
jgi:hypothetical protein